MKFSYGFAGSTQELETWQNHDPWKMLKLLNRNPGWYLNLIVLKSLKEFVSTSWDIIEFKML